MANTQYLCLKHINTVRLAALPQFFFQQTNMLYFVNACDLLADVCDEVRCLFVFRDACVRGFGFQFDV